MTVTQNITFERPGGPQAGLGVANACPRTYDARYGARPLATEVATPLTHTRLSAFGGSRTCLTQKKGGAAR